MIAAVTKEGYALAQEYLPEAEQGEKRLLLLNAEPLRVGDQVAIYRRRGVTGAGNGVRNRSRGGSKNGAGGPATRAKCEFGPVEARICDILRPRLLADGLTFVAVDIVGDRILELNVFTPGGLHPDSRALRHRRRRRRDRRSRAARALARRLPHDVRSRGRRRRVT